MSDFDPIEIELAINSPEVLKQAVEVDNTLKGLDKTVSTTEARFKKYTAEQLKATTTTAKQTSNVRVAKRQYDSLGNSINQITRELPSFTYSAQTGLMAISNNAPMLADEIMRLIQRNKELIASGQKVVPVWKQVIKSMFSWQTLLSLGITLMTVYGKEIGQFFSNVFKGKQKLNEFTETIKAVNEAFKSTSYTKAREEVAKMTSQIQLAKQGKLEAIDVLNQYNKGLGKVIGSVKSLDQAESNLLKKKDAYVKMMLYKSAASAFLQSSNEQIIELVQKEASLQDKLKTAQKRLNEYSKLSPNEDIIISNKTDRFDSYSGIAKRKAEGLKSAVSEAKSELQDLEKQQTKIYQDILGKAAKLANENGINFFKEEDVKNFKSEINNRKQLLQKLADLDAEYSRKQLTQNKAELQALRDKFGKIRKLITDFNANDKNKAKIDITGLDGLQKKAEATLLYRQNTTELTKQLEQESQVFAAYEALKTKVSTEEANERYGKLLKGFNSYGELLQSEYKKLQGQLQSKDEKDLTGAEIERLLLLKNKLADFENTGNKEAEERFVEAYNSAITHKEVLAKIEADFAKRKLEVAKITDTELRVAKTTELERQKQIAIDNANAEAYEKTQIFQQLSENLIGITKRELAVRIASIEQYLQASKGRLTQEQEAQVKAELKKAKAIQASTDIGVQEKALLQRKKEILHRITELQNKGVKNVSDELKELENVNQELKKTFASKTGKIADAAYQLGGALKGLASNLAYFDEGLADTVDTMGDLINVSGDVASSVMSFASGDVVGGITGAISAIGGLFSMSAKARESERKAQEEMKKYHDEIFKSSLNYNASLRKRILQEVKLNDLYRSRVANIKEEQQAHKKNAKQILEDQNAVFKRLLNAQTVVGKQTYKTGGFLGFWKKTKVRDVKKTISEVLGLGKSSSQKINIGFGRIMNFKHFVPNVKDVKLTDDLFRKLEKINATKPLTGDAKSAYEQLKKLRDEYGSIEEAQRQLQKQLKDTTTATTAKALADSIKQGIASGKKTFADFADDIEGFLRNAILQGMSTKMIEPKMQKLQDLLFGFMGDGVITADEKQQFQQMYMKIADEARQYMNMVNSSGINIGGQINEANSLKGAVKGMTETQADLLAGQFGGLRLTQLSTNKILKGNHAEHLELTSKQIEIQQDIEKNTRRTADNTEKLKSIDKTLTEIKESSKEKTAKANGIP